MGDPRAYITPDVVADFGIDPPRAGGARSRARLGRAGPAGAADSQGERLLLRRLEGERHADHLGARGGREGARRSRDLFWKRLGLEFAERHVELIGHSACWGPLAPPVDPPEVLLRLSVRDPDKAKIERVLEDDPGGDPLGSARRGGHRRPAAGAGSGGLLAGAGAARSREAEARDPRRRAHARMADADSSAAEPPGARRRASWPKAKGSVRSVTVPLSRTRARAQRRQGRHREHRRDRARARDLPVAQAHADRGAGEAALQGHLPAARSSATRCRTCGR